MSTSIDIPTTPSSASTFRASQSSSKAATSSSSSDSDSPRPGTSPSVQKQKRKMAAHQRRPSLLSSAISKQECTVINVGDPDGTPRLVSYLSSSQGYIWNPEIFLPSYVDYDYEPIENRRDPVHDIVLSEEESKNMLPQ